MRLRAALALLLVAALAAAAAARAARLTGPEEDVRDARRRWRATRPAAYEYTLERSCFCLAEVVRPTVIVVRGDAVESLRYATGEPVDPRLASVFPTIDGLFDQLADVAAREPQIMRATYDRARGYPLRVEIDVSEQVADDEITYVVRSFRPL